MAKGNYIFGLDVGTSNIKSVVGEILPNLPLQIISANISPSSGVRRDQVFDIEDTAESIQKNIEEVEEKIGEKIPGFICSIGGPHIKSIVSRGVVAVSRANGEVSDEDIDRVIKAAEAVSLPSNKEIIHTIPREFVVDKERGIKDPRGMHGVRLEVECNVIFGSSVYINNLIKAVEGSGSTVENLVFSTLAGATAVLSKRQKELGVLVLDLSGGSTGMCVFEEQTLLSSSVLPVGASHITNDIAIAFQLPIDIAEKLKIKYGAAESKNILNKEKIQLKELGGEERVISRKKLVEVIEARNLEILELVNKELRKIGREKLLPAGVVLIGGGAKMPGMEELVKAKLHLPCQIGFPKEVEGIVDKIDDPSFATVVGLLLWQLKEEREEGRFQRKFQIGKKLSKIKKWFEELLP